jgi:DNA-binding transcriptional MerR regulator
MKIGQLARITATSVETVRFYEASGLLPHPPRTNGNYRDYAPAAVTRLAFIRRARELGFGLDSVRELLGLADEPDKPCSAVDAIAGKHLGEVQRKLADLTRLADELASLLAHSRHGSIGDCRIIEALGITRP